MGNSVTRRTLVKGAAFAGTLAITGRLAGGIPSALADDGNGNENTGAAATVGASAQYGFWVNTANCVACFNCVETCRRSTAPRRTRTV